MPPPTAAKIDLYFYRSAGGNEPVRDWLKALPEDQRREVGLDLQRVQYRWPIGMPLCRSMGNGLWEVRTALPGGNIARVFICFHAGDLYALHGFIKKTQKTPADDLNWRSAGKRMWNMADNKHKGSSLDSLFEEEGALGEMQARAIKEVIAWQLGEAMREQKLSKRRLALMMHTSRTQVDRVLDPNDGNVTLETLQRAAAVVGRRVQVALV